MIINTKKKEQSYRLVQRLFYEIISLELFQSLSYCLKDI